MRPDPRILLADVDRAATDIVHFTKGTTCEALNRLYQSSPEVAGRIPPLREVVGFRNLLIHGYAVVIPDQVWDYTENGLPELHRIVRILLAEMEPPEE